MYTNLEPPPPTSPLLALPMDIIADIFCRLPVKTLLRCKCLSKQFLSLINSPNFINRHLQFSSLSPKLILFEQQTSLLFHFLNINTFDNVYDVDIPFVDLDISDSYIEVIGSCDGLLALSNRRTGTTILCNIPIRKHKILPFSLDDYVESIHLVWFGFGRGACFDDYKLVRVASSRHTPEQVASLSVYSLKTDSWRTIADFLPSYLSFTQMAALFKGTLNFFFVEYSEFEDGGVKGRHGILSFDLNNDNFFLMKLPICIRIDSAVLKDGGECLCLLDLVEEIYYNYNIWVMKEYGVENSWIKMYSVFLPSEIHDLCNCVFSMHFDKFIFVDGYQEVFVWDLKEGRCEITKPLLLPSQSRGLNFTFESLVPLGITG